jgi:hypothetical protein
LELKFGADKCPENEKKYPINEVCGYKALNLLEKGNIKK